MKAHFSAFAIFLMMSSGCATDINQVKQDAELLDNKVVTVGGEVISTTNLLVTKYYKLKDNTGQIVIISNQELPNKGESLRVKGTVHQYMKIGDTNMTVIKEIERNKSWY